MFDNLLESSRWDDSNKWPNTGFGQEIDVLEMKIRTLSGALSIFYTFAIFFWIFDLTQKQTTSKTGGGCEWQNPNCPPAPVVT